MDILSSDVHSKCCKLIKKMTTTKNVLFFQKVSPILRWFLQLFSLFWKKRKKHFYSHFRPNLNFLTFSSHFRLNLNCFTFTQIFIQKTLKNYKNIEFSTETLNFKRKHWYTKKTLYGLGISDQPTRQYKKGVEWI